MENIIFKKRYAPITGDENNIYKTLSEPSPDQNLDSDRYGLSVLEEVICWVLVGVGIGVILLAFYILLVGAK